MLGMEIRLGLNSHYLVPRNRARQSQFNVATSKAGLSSADSRCGTADGTVCRAFTLTANRQTARIVTAALTRLNAPNMRLDPHNSTFSRELHRTFFFVIAFAS